MDVEVNNYIDIIDSKLSILLNNIPYEDYINIIKSDERLNKYDFILGKYSEYNNIPNDIRNIFNIEFLNYIISLLDKKITKYNL